MPLESASHSSVLFVYDTVLRGLVRVYTTIIHAQLVLWLLSHLTLFIVRRLCVCVCDIGYIICGHSAGCILSTLSHSRLNDIFYESVPIHDGCQHRLQFLQC
jgi:hypothetical protein